MLVTTRFTLPAAELAGALSLAGIAPEPGSTLPPPAPFEQVQRVLGARGVLDDSGMLVPELDAALRVAAAPERLLLVRAVRVGAPAARQTLLVRTAGRPEVVAFTFDGTDYDLVLVPNSHLAVVLIDEMLLLTDLGTGDGTEILELDLPALAALLALVDAATAATYATRLGRQPTPTEVVASPANLTALWDQGVEHDDTRWAVTAVRAVAPIDLAPQREHLAGGLATLARLGLVTGSGDGTRTTEQGRLLATVLGQLLVAANLVVAIVEDGHHVPIAPVTLLRTATTIWVASWSQPIGSEPRVTFAELTSEGALALLCDLLEEIVPTPTAPVATPVAAAPPQPPPPAPPVAPAWAPTHRVPAGGLPTWVTPDAAQPPGQHLAGGLLVQVTQRQGAWAYVVCENGWAAWVDGRYLEVG